MFFTQGKEYKKVLTLNPYESAAFLKPKACLDWELPFKLC